MNLKQRLNYQDNGEPKLADASRSKTLAHGLELLKWIAARPGAIGVREMARETGLNVALVQRLVNSHNDAGFLERDSETHRYRIGAMAFHVGQAFLSETGLVESARPILRELSTREHLNSYLAILREDECIYLCVEQSAGALTVHSVPGDRVPVHTTAIGKVLLAGLPDEEAKKLLERAPLEKRTEKTVVSFSEISEQLESIRAGGVAISDEENIPGIFAIGAPVIDATGQTVAALSCACAVHLSQGDGRKRVADAALKASREISRRLGAPMSLISKGES